MRHAGFKFAFALNLGMDVVTGLEIIAGLAVFFFAFYPAIGGIVTGMATDNPILGLAIMAIPLVAFIAIIKRD